MKRNLKSVRDFASGGPLSEGSIRWLVFNAGTNGLAEAGAIVRIGRRVLIDVDAFDKWIDQQNRHVAAAAA